MVEPWLIAYMEIRRAFQCFMLMQAPALVKLLKGPHWQPGVSLDLIALQLKHMRNLWRLRRLKKAVLAGPLPDGGQIRGIVIFKAGTAEEVRQLIESDPAVQAGRLSYEIGEF